MAMTIEKILKSRNPSYRHDWNIEKVLDFTGYVFVYPYPIKKEYKLDFERHFCRHFYKRELCTDNVGEWSLYLSDRLNSLFPYLNDYLERIGDYEGLQSNLGYYENKVDLYKDKSKSHTVGTETDADVGTLKGIDTTDTTSTDTTNASETRDTTDNGTKTGTDETVTTGTKTGTDETVTTGTKTGTDETVTTGTKTGTDKVETDETVTDKSDTQNMDYPVNSITSSYNYMSSETTVDDTKKTDNDATTTFNEKTTNDATTTFNEKTTNDATTTFDEKTTEDALTTFNEKTSNIENMSDISNSVENGESNAVENYSEDTTNDREINTDSVTHAKDRSRDDVHVEGVNNGDINELDYFLQYQELIDGFYRYIYRLFEELFIGIL